MKWDCIKGYCIGLAAGIGACLIAAKSDKPANPPPPTDAEKAAAWQKWEQAMDAVARQRQVVRDATTPQEIALAMHELQKLEAEEDKAEAVVDANIQRIRTNP